MSLGTRCEAAIAEHHISRVVVHGKWRIRQPNGDSLRRSTRRSIATTGARLRSVVWAVTRYKDIVEISKDSARFANMPRPAIRLPDREDISSVAHESGRIGPDLLELDAPEHTALRRALVGHFFPA